MHPDAAAPSAGGNAVRGPKMAPEGFRNSPISEPTKTEIPPVRGPSRNPISGAVMTPRVMFPLTPIAMVKGMTVTTA
jgi:hypothetical protein